MQKIGVLSIVMVLFCVYIPYVPAQRTIQSTIYVDDDNTSGPWDGSIEHPFRYIQDGINASVDGDNIYVYSGFYQEHLYIKKEIIVKGENRNTTIIDGGSTGATIIRIENSVGISNFTIQNKGGSHYEEIDDGMILGCNDVSVKNMNFIGCGLSYDFVFNSDESYHNILTDNFVNEKPLIYLEDKTDKIVDYLCGQIILVNCKNITITHQNISNLRFGIIVSHSNNCHVRNNQIMNTSYGILVYFSDNNTISENILSSNYRGIIYQGSNRNMFMNNTIESNSIGIYDNLSPYLSGQTSNNNIKNNFFRNNIEGVRLYSSAFIYNNEFRNNDLAVSIFEKSPIQNNNFYFNKRDVWIFTTPSTYTDTIIDGNYWGRPRVLSKPTLGIISYGGIAVIPWFFIDWHPAKVPNNISGEINEV